MNLLLADLHKFVGYSGGIEHVLSRMALAMQDRGFHVSAVMADEKAGRPFYPFPEAVPIYNLFHPGGGLKYPSGKARFYKFRRELIRPISSVEARNLNYRILALGAPVLQKILDRERPDVIISFREPTGRLLLEDLKVKTPVISMLHNDPDEIFKSSPKEEKQALMKSRYIQVLMPSFIEKAKRYLPYDHFVCIPNTVAIPEVQADPGKARKVHTIVNVGRVTGRTKRQHLLVEAFALVADHFPDWRVQIWGDMYDKIYVMRLRKMIEDKGLKDRVFLMGTTRHMWKVWADCDIFAFPSHHEGFPLALTEALGAGIPAVGYKSCPAVNELIIDGKTGFLVDDGAEPLAEALKKLMSQPQTREKMGKNARASMKPFAPEVVWNRWESLIDSCAGSKVKLTVE